ncbi:MAG TPA: tetratricopeptide repeat protein, partial [Candidatus Dormibacteraeota bacterium]|nr:tetratricopeptide repeat protein [Candidatus Dormibacteraeota bacterium]
RPGAVRDARAQSGLSLAGVAGADVTRAAIHRIEKGQIRPSRRTLELIAERTGKPLEFFLADPAKHGVGAPASDLRRLEQFLLDEDHPAAIELGQRVLASLHDPARRASVALGLGSAMVLEDDVEHGIPLLREALAHYSKSGDAWSAVDAKDMLALAQSKRHEAGAEAMFEEALADCARLDPPRADLESRIYNHLGHHHVRTHEWRRAVEMYERALEAAGPLRDLAALAMMYNGLAAAYEQLGDLARASAYSHRALAVHEMDHDRRSIARVENNLGLVLLRSGQIAEAEAHLRKSLALSEETGLEAGRAHVLLSLGELELARGAVAAAEAFAGQAMAIAEAHGERLSVASAQRIIAEVREQEGDTEAADAAWRRALDSLAQLGATKRLMECHTRYSEVLEARGNAEAALSHTRMALALADPSLASRPPLAGQDDETGFLAG